MPPTGVVALIEESTVLVAVITTVPPIGPPLLRESDAAPNEVARDALAAIPGTDRQFGELEFVRIVNRVLRAKRFDLDVHRRGCGVWSAQ